MTGVACGAMTGAAADSADADLLTDPCDHVQPERTQRGPQRDEDRDAECGVAEQLRSRHAALVAVRRAESRPQEREHHPNRFHGTSHLQRLPNTIDGSGAATKSSMIGASTAMVGTSIAARRFTPARRNASRR